MHGSQKRLFNCVINAEIDKDSLADIFRKIDELLGKKRLDLIIGGPPCQAYSIVGRSRDGSRMQGDNRNYFYVYYAEFLKRYKPVYFIFENVTGLLSARDQDGNLYFDKMRILFREAGYETEFKTSVSRGLRCPPEPEEDRFSSANRAVQLVSTWSQKNVTSESK